MQTVSKPGTTWLACSHIVCSLSLSHTDTFGLQGNSSSGDLFRNSCPTNMYKTNIRCTGGTHVDTTCQPCISTCSKGIEGLGWSPPLNPGVCCLYFILHASFSFEPGCVLPIFFWLLHASFSFEPGCVSDSPWAKQDNTSHPSATEQAPRIQWSVHPAPPRVQQMTCTWIPGCCAAGQPHMMKGWLQRAGLAGNLGVELADTS